jgi:predicted nucleic acid-binding protein
LIALGDHPLTLGVTRDETPDWLVGLVDAGRDAAYVDTWYLRALLDDYDDHHAVVAAHWEATTANFYTSPLVIAEAVRQVAKHGEGVTQQWRWERVTQTKVMIVDDRSILICAPPEEALKLAFVELVEMQQSLPRLDLCDSLSMVILNALQHRRVLGSDDHFRYVGAALEP